MKKICGYFLLLIANVLLSQNVRVRNTLQFHTKLPDDKLCYTLNDSSFNIRFSDPELALEFAQNALPIAEKIKDEHLTATSWFNIGTAFHIIGTYDSAMYYYQKAEKYFLKSDNPKFIGTVYLQIGLIFGDTHDEKRDEHQHPCPESLELLPHPARRRRGLWRLPRTAHLSAVFEARS